MSTDAGKFEEFFKQFDELTPEERERLLNELELRRAQRPQNGEKPKTLFDAFNARGMIGSIKDAPADWSTNPKYMEGFGKDAE